MFFGRQGEFPIFGPRPINQPDVFVRFRNAMDVQKARRDEGARAGRSGGRTFSEQLDFQPAFLARLAQGGLLRVFVQFDVPAERQPFVELAVMNEQDFSILDDEDRHGEINFFVDMGHDFLRRVFSDANRSDRERNYSRIPGVHLTMKGNRLKKSQCWFVFFISFALVASALGEPDDLVQAYNGFGLKLLSEINKTFPNHNILICPLGAALTIAMLREGAQGQTEKEIREVLQADNINGAGMTAANHQLLDLISAQTNTVTLEIANSLWVDKPFMVKPDFVRCLQDNYHAATTNLDFADPNAAAIVNRWAGDHTRGLITEILQAPLSSDTCMILANTFYFKGEWESRFDPNLTQARDFTLANGSRAKCPMMMQSGRFLYFENRYCQAVFLPYKSDQPYGVSWPTGMYVFLPRKTSGLSDFLQSLNSTNLGQWLGEFKLCNGPLEFPKFKMTARYKLNAELKAMGMQRAFVYRAADFRLASAQPMFVDRVLQKSFIQVDEAGTVGGEFSVVAMGRGGPPPAFHLEINHPFFAAIVDGQTGVILMACAVFDPKQ